MEKPSHGIVIFCETGRMRQKGGGICTGYKIAAPPESPAKTAFKLSRELFILQLTGNSCAENRYDWGCDRGADRDAKYHSQRLSSLRSSMARLRPIPSPAISISAAQDPEHPFDGVQPRASTLAAVILGGEVPVRFDDVGDAMICLGRRLLTATGQPFPDGTVIFLTALA